MTSDLKIEYVANRFVRVAANRQFDASRFSPSAADVARGFHRRLVGYKPTPLVRLRALARSLGITALWVKDESHRFGLDAFKVLGASYAIGKFIAQKLEVSIEEVSFDSLRSLKLKRDFGELTFVTATDGNHGRAVAWAARELGQRAVVYLPQGASAARVANIRSLGADASVTTGSYDESVEHAANMAEKHNWILLQDTAWPGYEEIPMWVMQGYLTMFAEAVEQLQGEKPTHVFIQAGVGSLAGALHGYLKEHYGEDCPLLYVVEPTNAACFFASAKTDDGLARTIPGDLDTIMVGLAAGRPSSLAWPILRDHSDGFFTCSDAVAATGMRVLAKPVAGDPRITSGEAGAVTAGLVTCLSNQPELRTIAGEIHKDSNSKILLFSTEGATDPDMYQRIVG
ncbi:MAG: diaminopropionate ammonia-lyase [Acidiferrobacterales bacterium]